MIRPAGRYKRKDGTWETFWTIQPDACLCEPSPGGDYRAPAYLPTITYPTLAQVSEHQRRGMDLTHAQLVDIIELLLGAANAPPDQSRKWLTSA